MREFMMTEKLFIAKKSILQTLRETILRFIKVPTQLLSGNNFKTHFRLTILERFQKLKQIRSLLELNKIAIKI